MEMRKSRFLWALLLVGGSVCQPLKAQAQAQAPPVAKTSGESAAAKAGATKAEVKAAVASEPGKQASPEPAKVAVPVPVNPAPGSSPSSTTSPASTGITAPGNKSVFLDRQRITEILKVENPLVWPMILCSVVAFGFFLDRWFSLRKARIVPREFVNRFLDRLGSGKLDRERAFDLCKANDTPASRVFAQVLMMWGEPAGQIRSAISQAVGMEYMQLRKNIRVLNATATLAPLIGLLGTVVGIIESFNALGAKNVPSKSAALAEGIGLALVMTALGLVVAIGSVTAYYYLLGRLDSMMVALEQEALRVMELVAGSSGKAGGERRSERLEVSRGIDSRIA